MQILESTPLKDALFLLDAGLYSFNLIYTILQKDEAGRHAHSHFLIKVPCNLRFEVIEKLADGSSIAIIRGKIEDPNATPRRKGQKSWKKIQIKVRLIHFQIPGFKPVTLISSL